MFRLFSDFQEQPIGFFLFTQTTALFTSPATCELGVKPIRRGISRSIRAKERRPGRETRVQCQTLTFTTPHPTPVQEGGPGLGGAPGEARASGRVWQRPLITSPAGPSPVSQFSCHFGPPSQIEPCFPNWLEKRFCHAEIISRAISGNLRQPGSWTAGL